MFNHQFQGNYEIELQSIYFCKIWEKIQWDNYFQLQENFNTYSDNEAARLENLKVLGDSFVSPLYSFAYFKKVRAKYHVIS